MVILIFWFFFFKQKTAYEMRISDWSSDVCSSDLPNLRAASEIVHAPDVVDAGDKPSVAIRKKTSSMSMAIAAVKAGDCGAAVSSGNTGALIDRKSVV